MDWSTRIYNRADCHCHTTCSDGRLSPTDLLDLAKLRGLDALSITDHDTTAAYQEALPYAQKLGILLISGIEISAQFQQSSVHILGYGFDLNHPLLACYQQSLKAKRIERNQHILAKLAKLNMPISESMLHERFGEGIIGRPHIATLLVEKGYIGSIKAAFKQLLGDKARCFVKGYQVEALEAIEFIHQIGGYAVIAHPAYFSAQKNIPELTKLPFDGIEVYYGRMNNTQIQPWRALAQQKNWLMTGGSDFHGSQKGFELGCSYTPSEQFALLAERYFKNNPNTVPAPAFATT